MPIGGSPAVHIAILYCYINVLLYSAGAAPRAIHPLLTGGAWANKASNRENFVGPCCSSATGRSPATKRLPSDSRLDAQPNAKTLRVLAFPGGAAPHRWSEKLAAS
jgi:hypothetical protein